MLIQKKNPADMTPFVFSQGFLVNVWNLLSQMISSCTISSCTIACGVSSKSAEKMRTTNVGSVCMCVVFRGFENGLCTS